QYRDVQACSGKPGSASVMPGDCSIWNDPKRTLLGTAQEQWLDAAFARAGQRDKGWNIVGQQTLFGKLDTFPGPGELLWNDGWTGYPAAQRRFTDAVQRHRVPNMVLLGGDVHQNWVGHVKADYNNPKSASVGVEFCGTSITSRGSTGLPKFLPENPHFVFAEAHKRGYGVAEFTPDKLTTTLRVVDDVTKRDAAIGTLARFEVQAGRAVVERA
ncbi:alkaline phosphatase D family protein, partial [Leptospira sp. SA-E8]|uniref:alkaline phosphatase D family protein n=1 Tax=Leptospira sp. SA-E8 TaxID=3422259 RepID=UPI003EB9CA9B